MGISNAADAKWVVDAFVQTGRVKVALGDGGHTWPQRGWSGGEAQFTRALCAGFVSAGEGAIATGQRRAAAEILVTMLRASEVDARIVATPEVALVDAAGAAAGDAAGAAARELARLAALEARLAALDESLGSGGAGGVRGEELQALGRLLLQRGAAAAGSAGAAEGAAPPSGREPGARRALARRHCELVGALPSRAARGSGSGSAPRPIEIGLAPESGGDGGDGGAGADEVGEVAELERAPLVSILFGLSEEEAMGGQSVVLHGDLERSGTVRKALAAMHRRRQASAPHRAPGALPHLATYHLPHRHHNNKVSLFYFPLHFVRILLTI